MAIIKIDNIWQYKNFYIVQKDEETFFIQRDDNLSLLATETSLERAKNFIFNYTKSRKEEMTQSYETSRMPYIEMTADEIKTYNERMARVPIINLQSKKEFIELGKDLEYLNKVAIEAMKVYIVSDKQTYSITAKYAYEQAKAMLAEKKRIEAELLGVGNDV